MKRNKRQHAARYLVTATLILVPGAILDEPDKHFDASSLLRHSSPSKTTEAPEIAASPLVDANASAETEDIAFANFGTLEEVQWDMLAPYASTVSSLTIQAQLYSAGGASLNYSNVFAGATSSTGTRAIATNFGGFPAPPNTHSAIAHGNVFVSPTPSAIPGGVNLATISTTHQTAAGAFSSEPFASKAVVTTQGGVSGIGIQTNSTCQPNTNPDTLLDIAWNVHHLDLTAKPTVAFAFMRDTVNVIQQVDNRISVNQIGFIIYMENGKTTRIPIDTTGNQSIAAWMQQNLQQTGNSISGGGRVDVPVVVMDPCDPHKSTVLSIRNVHTEASYEVPPRAVPQVGSKVGFAPDSNHPDANIHWDTTTQTLAFDPLPINVLTEDRKDAVSPTYQDDPLNGGTINVGPALRFTQLDGREYFAGNKLQLFDHNDDLLLQASLPTLVYEDTLADEQGFELFAPILNIEWAKKGTSPWLDTFLGKIGFDSDLIPELFVDLLDMGNDNPWDQSFDSRGRVILSYASPFRQVPGPATFVLLFPNLLGLIWFSRRLAHKGHVKADGH